MGKYKRQLMAVFRLLACLMACLPAESCREGEDAPATEQRAALVLYTGIMGKTRAAETPDKEKIHTLRIVLLRPDGTVEFNRYIDGLGASETYVQTFWVIPNETKTLVLIANEYAGTGFGDVLNRYYVGTDGFLEAVNDLSFTFDATKPLPMTGIYEIPSIGNEETLSQTLNVVRAATKFSFEFVNEHDTEVEVKSISVSKLADKSYLLPRLTREGIWCDRENSGTFASYGFELDGVRHDSWAEWLQAVVDKQQNATEDRTTQMYSDQDGWILEYDIPDADGQAKTLLTNASFDVPGNAANYQLDRYFYYPESKNLKTESPQIPVHEQSYTLSLEMGDKGKKSYLFTTELPNLRALFRNTHVRVTVHIKKHVYQQIEVNTALVPWEEGKGEINIDITSGLVEPGLTEK